MTDPFSDYGQAHSTQVAHQNYQREADARRERQAEEDRQVNERNAKRRDDGPPPINDQRPTGPEETESAKTHAAQAAIPEHEKYKAEKARERERYQRRLEAEKPAVDQRSSAQKLADRFAAGQ